MIYTRPLACFLAASPLLSPLIGVLLGVWIADVFELHHFVYALVIAAALAVTLRKTWISTFVLGFMSAYLLHGLTVSYQNKWLSDTPKEIQLTGIIIDAGVSKRGPYLFQVFHTPESSLPDGVNLVLMTPRNVTLPLQHGDIFSTRGRLEAIPELRNPYGFDLATWRHRQGANLSLVTTDYIQNHGVRPSSKLARLMENWRDHIRKKITVGINASSMEAQIIRAVVLGEKPLSSEDHSSLIENFRLSGTLHVFAVSGLHVGMVALILNFSLSWLCVPRSARIMTVIIAMTLYAGITGFHAPAIRATIMGTVIMGGFLLKRKPSILNSLALSAVIVLLWDGHQLFTPGFQLSYGVLLSIALIARVWNHLLSPLTDIDPFMPRLLLSKWQTIFLSRKNWLKNALSVSLSAAIGSTPLIWLHFGIITPISVIAGIPLMLIVFSILALSMLSLSIGSLIAPTAGLFNKTNALTAQS
ncbi:ComEC family competence protein, partial [Akkermansiaceae bacterium]|nr:ComEC family competence protein [Akkermansiaceae bacterium]